MQSLNSFGVKSLLKLFSNGNKEISLSEQRRRLDRFGNLFSLPKEIEIRPAIINTIPVEWLIPQSTLCDDVMLYLHGGAYCAGSIASHRAMVAFFAKNIKMRALMLAYRLAPEHPFPAALEDVISVYEMLLRNNPATEIIFAGDSAGGGLALAALHRLKEMNRPLPRAAVLLAPWLDLSCESETYASVGAKDVLLGRENLLKSARMYAGNRDLKHPAISPLFADLSGLPPILIQVGTHDVLWGM